MSKPTAQEQQQPQTMSKPTAQEQQQPQTISDYDHRDNNAWLYSFSAAMIPFTAFCYGHQRGLTGRVVERMVKMPGGVYGLFLLPFCTLAMEKSIYDTVQAWQGIDPNTRPADRGGFPSGGANLPSLSLIPVQKKVVEGLTKQNELVRKLTQKNFDQ